MNKKRAISILLVIAMLATNIPAQILDVFAASETYDIEYADGAFTENGKASDKEVSDYFTMKKITTSFEEDGTTQKGASITEEGEATIVDSNIQLPNSTWTSKTAAHTSYLIEFNNSVAYNNLNRRIESYEVTTASKIDWIGRPNGLLLPFYYDSNLDGYFGLFFVTRSSNAYFQYGYSFVGRNREYANNSVGEAALSTRTDADGNTIASTMNINLTYVYSDDGSTIEKITFSVTECWADGVETTLIDNKSFTVTDVTTGNKGFIGGANGASGNLTSDNCPTSFASSGAIAGVISGNNVKRSTISGIKVSLSKTEDEINSEAAGALPDLYQEFLDNKCYATANAYLEVYATLPDETKADYAVQIGVINAFLKDNLVSNGVLNFDKATLNDYPAVLEYVWSTSGKETTDKTSINSSIYGLTDAVKTTAVFDKAQILKATSNTTNSSLYMFSDLATDSETASTVVEDFGVTFKKSPVYFATDAEGTTGSLTLPIVEPNKTNLSTTYSNVVYKAGSYGTDTWVNDLKNTTNPDHTTPGTPLSYDAYQIVNSLEYMAVELIYVATENPTAASPYSKIEFTARMWTDDGDGVYEEDTEVLLINITKRSGDDAIKSYLAISYLDEAPRVRNMALTKDGFDALVSIQVETPTYFLEKHADVITEAAEFVLDDYLEMSSDEQTKLKSDIDAFVTDYSSLTDAVSKHVDVVLAYTNVNAMLELIKAEDSIADNMMALYIAFKNAPTYVTAGNYYEAYIALTDAKKSNYEAEIQEVYNWIDGSLVSGVALSVDKSAIESYPNMMEYIWPVGDAASTDNTRVNEDIYDFTDVVKTTAVFKKSSITKNTKLFMFSDLADTHEEEGLPSGYPDDFGVAFTNRNISYYTDAAGTEKATISIPLIDANIMDVKLLGGVGNNIIYKSANPYGTDRWGQDMVSKTTLLLEEKEKIDSLDYMAVELAYVATEYPDATNPYTKIVYTAKLWADDGDGLYNEETDFLLIDGGNTTKTTDLCIAYTTVNKDADGDGLFDYSEDFKPRLRKAALTADAFNALHSIKMESPVNFLSKHSALIDGSDSSQESMESFLDDYKALSDESQKVEDVVEAYESVLTAYAAIVLEKTGVDVTTFTDDYADALALKANRLAPYDIPTVDVMLAAYVTLSEEIATRIFDADTMTVITALKSVREQWDTTNDTTIASSYQNIYGATLSSNPEDAWNVYNRLTAVQKKKLASEYATLISTLKGQTQETTDTVNIYCVGDSLTNGVTSTVTTEQAYPAQLQALLGTDAYTVTKHAEGGTTVYAWTESLKAFTSSTKYTSSLDGSADIVILQLGTNDLDYITDDEAKNTYLAALENLIHSYLRLDNSPYLIISNTPVNYRNVNSAVAALNSQLACEYGIPCVDLYAYTSAYSSDEQDTYYADDNLHFTAEGYTVMAQVFCDAVQSLTTEFDTADVTGYSFDESYLNSFLTPKLHSATIKNETDPAKQGLGFETFFSKYHRTGADIVAYGTIFSRYKSSADYSDMTLENVGNGLYFKATLSTSDDSGLEETSYIAGINCSTNEEFKKVYIARSYIVYEDEAGNQTVYYSINTREDIASSYADRVGVVNGYATRSLISVAKTMIKALAVQGITDSNVATYDEATDRLTVLPTATENDAVAIFAFLCGNQDKLDAVYKTVYLSASGSDTNAGTSDAPYATLDKALASVPNDGTIAVVGDYALASGYAWNVRSKAVTITGADSGGNLDFTAVSNVVIGNDVTFENITLTFNESDNLFANGHTLVIGEGVTTPNLINVYGGGRAGSTVASTNVTLLSGSYQNIYGGSFYGTVTGDTWLTVGGNVNPGTSVAVHEGTTQQRIYAGGNTDTIGGDTHCTFEGSAQAYQLFGGSVGADAKIAGVSNIEFNSGSVYGIFGGNDKSSNISGANVTVTGGTIAQIFGANQKSNMGSVASKATVNLEVLGGTITRRIYGGCYNDGDYDFRWTWADTGYHVTGNINLTLSGNANITFSEDAADLSIYACSRWSPAFDEEVCKIIFDASGYSKYYSKLGFNDSSWTNKTAMSSAMGSVDPCDSSNAADFE